MSTTVTALACERCGTDIAPDDRDFDLMLAGCASCGHVFSLPEGSPAEGAREPRVLEQPTERPVPEMPGAIEVSEDGGLTIRVRWFGARGLFLLFFALFWDGFLVVWYANALGSGDAMALLFPLIHVAVGVGVTWLAVATLLNTTEIRVADRVMHITHAPVPWPGARVVPTRQLEQLYCTEKVKRTKNGVQRTYDLCAVVAGGSRLRLLGGYSDADVVRYLEARIEEHLGIANRGVSGEWGG